MFGRAKDFGNILEVGYDHPLGETHNKAMSPTWPLESKIGSNFFNLGFLKQIHTFSKAKTTCGVSCIVCMLL